VKMFDAGKTRMIGLPYGKKNYDNMLSCFHLIPEHNGQTDRRTDRFAISISRVSMLTRDENSFTSCLVIKFSVYEDFHFTCSTLLHYLVKVENPKMLLNFHVEFDYVTINMFN